jgi:hypothetical protein
MMMMRLILSWFYFIVAILDRPGIEVRPGHEEEIQAIPVPPWRRTTHHIRPCDEPRHRGGILAGGC